MKPRTRAILREVIAAFFAVSILNPSIRALGGVPAINDLMSALAYGALSTGCYFIGRKFALMIIPVEAQGSGPDYYSEAIAEIRKESLKNEN